MEIVAAHASEGLPARQIRRRGNIRTCLGERRKIDGLQLASIFRIPEKNHLLPLDHSERVVLDDENLNRQLILHACGEFGHQRQT